jgi:hypothetical protein
MKKVRRVWKGLLGWGERANTDDGRGRDQEIR